MTQRELAEILGVPRSRLAQWETAWRGIKVIDYVRLKRILPGLPAVYARRPRNHRRMTVRAA